MKAFSWNQHVIQLLMHRFISVLSTSAIFLRKSYNLFSLHSFFLSLFMSAQQPSNATSSDVQSQMTMETHLPSEHSDTQQRVRKVSVDQDGFSCKTESSVFWKTVENIYVYLNSRTHTDIHIQTKFQAFAWCVRRIRFRFTKKSNV